MNSILHAKKILPFLLVVLISLISTDAVAQLIGWNANNTGGGFGSSPWTPATKDANITTTGLIRGSSISTGGTAAASCWGGSGGWNSTGGDVNSFYVTFQAKPGFVMNLSGISTATRRSNSGPSGAKVFYSVNGGAFVNVANWTTSSTSGTAGTVNTANLSNVTSLQNIPAGVVVKIRITPQGSTGNYYLTGAANALKITGTAVAAAAPEINTSVTALASFGDVVLGSESDAKTFTFNAIDMGTNDISISAAEHFQISTDNVNWYAGTDISPVAGVLTSMMVWVRFKPTSLGIKTGDITISAEGATSKTVSVSGNAIDGIVILPSLIDNLNYPEGQGPSVAVQPTHLVTSGLNPSTGELTFTVSAGSNYELAGNNLQWGDVATLSYLSANNAIENPTVYIRLKSGLTQGAIASETVQVSGGGFSTSFMVSGTVTVGSLDAPVVTEATNVNATGFTANWNAVQGALEYRLDVSTLATFDTLESNYDNLLVNGTSKIVTQLLPNTTYFYRVRAKTFSVQSQNSNVIETKTSCQTVALPTAVAHVLCAPATVEDLTATMLPGAVLKWYNDAVTSVELTNADVLSSKSYFVSQTVANGCESPRLEVSVTIKPKPDAPIAEAQQFCNSGTVGDLLPKQQEPSFDQITETFIDPNWGTKLNYSGVYPLTTGNWTVKNVGRLSTGTSDVYKRMYLTTGNSSVTAPPYLISPPFSGLKTVVVQAVAAITTNQLEVIKIVNGVETVLQTLSVPSNGTLTMTTYTVNVNDNNNDIRIKLVGKTGTSHSIAIGDVTFIKETQTTGIRWYEDPNGGVPLVETAALHSGNYYVSQIVNGCVSTLTEVMVTVTQTPDVPIVSNQAFCVEGTVADLLATANQDAILKWFDDAVSTTVLDGNTPLVAKSYFVSQSVNGCESPRAEVVVTLSTKIVPAFDSIEPICNGAILAALPTTSNNGITGTWSPALDNTATTEYTFTPDASECAEVAVLTITVNQKAVPVFDSIEPICSGTALVALPTTSNNGIAGTWSPALDNTTTTEYTFTPDSGQCALTTTLVITVSNTSKPTGVEIQDYTDGDMLSSFDVVGQNIKWYDAPIAGNELSESTLISAPGAVYYASQTILGCESSERLKIIAGADLKVSESSRTKLMLYPNPVNDMLYIDAKEQIHSVAVFTLLGQLVIQKNFNSTAIQIDLSTLCAGNYILQLSGNGMVKTHKIIKR